jgi:hypothetical protein
LFLLAVALPPLRPASFFCCVVPPCFGLDFEDDEPDVFPPLLDAPGEFAVHSRQCTRRCTFGEDPLVG